MCRCLLISELLFAFVVNKPAEGAGIHLHLQFYTVGFYSSPCLFSSWSPLISGNSGRAADVTA